MDTSLKKILWQQFGAAIDMLENAIEACPGNLWNSSEQFWYKAYHTIFYLDYYISEAPETFRPPSPFTLSEFDPSGILPEQVYNKSELLDYLSLARQRCHDRIASLTNAQSTEIFSSYKNYTITEILIYNIRHVQHHVAQLNMLLRQGEVNPPNWVSRTDIPL